MVAEVKALHDMLEETERKLASRVGGGNSVASSSVGPDRLGNQKHGETIDQKKVV